MMVQVYERQEAVVEAQAQQELQPSRRPGAPRMPGTTVPAVAHASPVPAPVPAPRPVRESPAPDLPGRGGPLGDALAGPTPA